jgi:hypothetical protein
VECFDSSEVFCTFYQGMLSYHGMLCLLSFEVWLSAAEPRALRAQVDQSLGRLLSFDPHAPFLGKRRRGGECHTTLIG